MTIPRSTRRKGLALAAFAIAAGATASLTAPAPAVAQAPPVFSLPEPPALTVPPPIPDLSAYVKDTADARKKLIVLGKAMFWDQNTGSTGIGCATCHFHAGADSRFKNQISPGLNDGDDKFGNVGTGKYASGAVAGANYTLKKSDFPMFQLVDEGNRDSAIKVETNDVVSSSGANNATYENQPNRTLTTNDGCRAQPDPVFHVGPYNTRRVEPRNTPTVVNAAYNTRNFWDGRANNLFNAVTPFGARDTNAFIVKHLGSWSKETAAIPNMSLASQAVGPVVSDLEMICQGRSLAEFGRKMLPRKPLSAQRVAKNDSVLGGFRDPGSVFGLAGTYTDLIKAVFKDEWWNGGAIPAGQTLPFEGYDQMEANFSLFWGIAVASYQGTLISDQSKYDNYKLGRTVLSTAEKNGLDLFRSSRTGCIFCHGGPLFSNATTVRQLPTRKFLDRVPGVTATHLQDDGFFNIGTRPTTEDLGVGGTDPFGNPLSLARQWVQKINGNTAAVKDPLVNQANACAFVVPFGTTGTCEPTAAQVNAEELAVDGAFKTPILRNVELTGPYFHYGQYGTLEQLVAFYNRGGDRRLVNDNSGRLDTSGLGASPSNLSALLVPLNLSPTQQSEIVAFLKTLTDERVRCEKAPFDHPSIRVPHGAKGDQIALQPAYGVAQDEFIDVPATGADGLGGIRRSCLGTFDQGLAN